MAARRRANTRAAPQLAQREDKDSSQCTTSPVASQWRAPWLWCLFMQRAFVWLEQAARIPHSDIPLHCGGKLMELAQMPMCGCGTTANVGEVTCAIAWPRCSRSGTKRGRVGLQMGTRRGMGAMRCASEESQAEEGQRNGRGAWERGERRQRSKKKGERGTRKPPRMGVGSCWAQGEARAMHVRCTGRARHRRCMCDAQAAQRRCAEELVYLTLVGKRIRE